LERIHPDGTHRCRKEFSEVERKRLIDSVELDGETIATSKSLKAVANALGYQARKLHAAATEHEALLAKMRDLGDAEQARVAQEREAVREARMKIVSPMIARGAEILKDISAAAKEARPVLARFDGFNWSAIIAGLPGSAGVVPGSSESTRTRLALLERIVGELRDLLGGDSTSELKVQLREAEDLGATEERWAEEHPQEAANLPEGQVLSQWGRQTVRRLNDALSRSDIAPGLRGKVAAIEKLCAAIGADVLPTTTTEGVR
jgi:hypothetical protein